MNDDQKVAESVFRALIQNETPNYLYAVIVEGMCREHTKRLYQDNTDDDITATAKAAVLLVNDYLADEGYIRNIK